MIVVTNTGPSTITSLQIVDTVSPKMMYQTTKQPVSLGVPTKTDIPGVGTRYVWSSSISIALGESLTVTISGQIGEVPLAQNVSNTAYVEASDSIDTVGVLTNAVGINLMASLPKLSIWETTSTSFVMGKLHVKYNISLSNISDISAWAVCVTTGEGSFVQRLKDILGMAFYATPYGGGTTLTGNYWSTSLSGPWNTGSSGGVGDPLYLRWIINRLGMHKSGCISYSTEVIPGPCMVLGASASATAHSGIPDFIVTGPEYASVNYNRGCAPPGASAYLSATGFGSSVYLNWPPSASGGNPISAYEIFRATCAGCPSDSHASVIGAATEYWDAFVLPGESYEYRVRAADGFGLFSPFSPMASSGPLPPLTLAASVYKRQSAPAGAIFGADGTISYYIRITNSGCVTITSLTMVDTISPIITGITTSQPAALGPPTISGVAGGTRFVWSATGLQMAPGQDFTVTIAGTIGVVELDMPLSNTAFVVAGDGSSEAWSLSNPVGGTVQPPKTLISVTKEQVPPDGSILRPGDPVDYRIVVTNTGNRPIWKMTVVDTVASVLCGTIYTEESPEFANPVRTQVPGVGTRFVWSHNSLFMSQGDSYTFVLHGRIGDACAPGFVSNTAYVDVVSNQGSNSAFSNSVAFTTTIPGTAISAVKEQIPPSGSTLYPGDPVTYRVIVTNTGAATITSLTVTDTVPSALAGMFTYSEQPPAMGAPALSQVSGVGTRYVWSATGLTLGPGATFTFTINGYVGQICGFVALANVAAINASSQFAQVSTLTNTVVFYMNGPVAQYTVTKLQDPGNGEFIGAGLPITYSIVVANTGETTADWVTLVDTVSPYVTNQATQQPAGFPAPTVTNVAGGTRYVWSTAYNLFPGESMTFTVTGIAGIVGGPSGVSNTAYVSIYNACGRTDMLSGNTALTVTPNGFFLPSAPLNLTAMADSPRDIRLDWDAATPGTNPIAGYNIYRATCIDCTYVIAGWTSLQAYLVTELEYGVEHYYKVKAEDSLGNEGPFSNMAFAASEDLTVTVWETAEPPSANAGDMVWYRVSFSNTCNFSAWAVMITTGAGSFAERKIPTGGPYASFWAGGVGTALTGSYWATSLAGPWNTTSAAGQTDPLYLRWIINRIGMHKTGYIAYKTEVLPGPCLVMDASASATMHSGAPDFDVAGPFDASVTGSRLCNPPLPPSALTAWETGGNIYLNWTPSVPGSNPVSAYEIFRATCVSCASSLLDWATGSVTEYTDAGVIPGITYEYRVRATDGYGGISGLSVPAWASIPVPVVLAISAEKVQIPSSGGSLLRGATIFYQILVTNTGTATITGLTITDTVPAAITGISTIQPGALGTPTVSGVPGGSHYEWSATGLTIAPGSVCPISITGSGGRVCSDTWLYNAAYVVASDGTSQVDTPTNEVSVLLKTKPSELQTNGYQIPTSGSFLMPGASVTYQIIVTNVGTETVTDLTITDTVSPILVSQSVDQPADFGTPSVTDVASGTRYSWSANGLTMPSGMRYTFTITGIVGEAPTGTTVFNTAFTTGVSLCDPNVYVKFGPTSFTYVFFYIGPGPIPPSAPAPLTAWTAGSQIQLNWGPSVPGTFPISGYQIYRATCVSCASSLLDWVAESVTEYTDTSIVPDVTYEYRVRAVDDSGGAGGFSPPAWATVPPALVLPSAPLNLTAMPDGPRDIRLDWEAATPGANPVAYYNIYRATCSDCLYSKAGSTSLLAYIITETEYGVEHYYKVKAEDSLGNEGPLSNMAYATSHDLTLSLWETMEPATANAGDIVTYRVSFSNTCDSSGWAVTITTLAGSFAERRVPATGPLYTFWAEGPGTVMTGSYWATSLAGPWNTSPSYGQGEPLYLRWVLNNIGMHKSGYITYKAEVLPGPCLAMDAAVSATMHSGNPNFYITPIYTASVTGSRLCNPPVAPSFLTSWETGGQIYLNWTPSTPGSNPVSAYEIFRATCVSCASDLTGWVPESVTEYLDITVVPDETYNYQVRATDGYGAYSGFSPAAWATVPNPATLDLTVVKQQVPPSGSALAAGTPVTYRLIVTNSGTSNITGITLTDIVSPSFYGPGAYQPADFGSPAITSMPSGTRFIWSSASLALVPGGSYTFTLTGVVGTVCADTVVSNTAFISAADASSSTIAFTNSVNFTAVAPTTNISVRKDQVPPSGSLVNPGDPVTYRIVVTNTGTATIDTVKLTDTISPVVTFPATSQPAPFGPPVLTQVVTGSRYDWSAFALAMRPGASYTFTISGNAGGVWANPVISNTAFVSASSPCSATRMFTGAVSFTMTVMGMGALGLTVQKQQIPPSGSALAVGTPVTYRLIVTNSGSSIITGMTLVDTVSPAFTSPATSQPGIFGAPVASGTAAGMRFIWSSFSLGMAPGTSYTFTITGAVGNVCANTTVSNTAYISTVDAVSSTRVFTNSVNFTAIAPTANISVRKDQIPPSGSLVNPGDPVTYRIVVTNTGSDTATHIWIADTVSPILVAQSVQQPAEIGAPIVTGVSGGTRYDWSAGFLSMSPGMSYTVTIGGIAGSAYVPTRVYNSALIEARFWCSSIKMITSETYFDLAPSLAASGTLMVTAEKQQWPMGSKTPTEPGVQVNYRIIVRNTGTTTITSLSVVDTVSPVVVNVSTDQPPGMGTPVLANTPSGSHYMWSATGLSFYPGTAWTFTITGLVGPVCNTQTIWNIAYVTAKDGPHTAKEPTNSVYFWELGRSTSIAVRKMQVPPSGASLTPGMNVSYLIVVTNNGTATVSGLSVVDTVTPILVNQSTAQPAVFGPPSITQVSSGTRYVWSASDIAMSPGVGYTFTVSGTVGTVPVTVSTGNTAYVSAVTACSATRMFTNGEGFTVNPSGALLFTFAGSPSATTYNQPVTVRLTVNNTGPSIINAVTPVMDPIPGYVGGPVPSGPLALSPGGSVTFTWDYLAKAQSPSTRMLFSATVTAFDTGTGLTLSRNVVTTVDVLASARFTATSLANPSHVYVGATFSLTLNVRNNGTGSASVLPSLPAVPGLAVQGSPIPAGPVTLAPGELRQFTWIIRADAAGNVTLLPGVTGTDLDTLQPVSAQAPTPFRVDSVCMAGTGTPGCRIVCPPGGCCPRAGQQVTAVVRSPRGGRVRMAIYDMTGRIVGVVEGYCYPNVPCYYRWNGRSRCGGGYVPPGGYGVIVDTPHRRYRGKILIVSRLR